MALIRRLQAPQQTRLRLLIGGSLECAGTQSRALSRGRFAYDPVMNCLLARWTAARFS
jgi:hypothetical protein